MAEVIVAAAIRVAVPEPFRTKEWNGNRLYPNHLTVTAPPPARHHTLLHVVGHGVAFEDQGFLTSTGRFVGREEGLQIAVASGQPMIDHPSRHSTWLFSEDLW